MSQEENSTREKEKNSEGQIPPQKVTPGALFAIAYLEKIQKKEIEASSLNMDQRMMCVEYLMHQGTMTTFEMAQILGVDRKTITRDRKKIREGNEISTLIFDEAHYAMDIIEHAELCVTRLLKEKKYKDAWVVKKECLETLQSMGFVKKVQPDLNIKGQISLKEVFEGAAEKPFRSDELSTRFTGDLLEGFVDRAPEGPVSRN